MLKYTGFKIELFKDISIFDYVNDSIFGVYVLLLKIFQMIKMESLVLVIFAAYIHML